MSIRCSLGYHFWGCQHEDEYGLPLGTTARFIKHWIFDTWDALGIRVFKIGPARLGNLGFGKDRINGYCVFFIGGLFYRW